MPQGRKTPAAKCPQALRNGIFRNITGHLSSIRPPSAAFPIPTKRHENSIFPDTPRHAVHTASPPERQDVRQSPQTLDTSPSVRPARIAYPHPSPDTDANTRFSESLRLTFCQTSPKASRAIPLAHLLKSHPAVRPALHLSPHHEMTIYSTVFKVIPPIFRNFAVSNELTKTTLYMFDNLSERLERSFKILKGEGKITEINVAETLKDVRRALLDADVNYKVAKTFTDTVKQKALGQNVLTAVKPSQLMVKIVHDELATLMGGETAELNLQGHPAVILMAGLNGAGKTTLSGKLALMLKNKKHKNPLLAACDIYRPAAIEQLKVLGEQIGIPVYSEPDSKDAVAIAQNAIKQAKAKGNDVVIVDTAGRLAVDEQMMQEIAAIKNAIQPDETLFVVDAMTGQDAVNTAKEFNDRLDFDGVVLTKLDGDTRGGAALSIRTVVNKPIKFIGTGEKMEAIDQFHPSRMADRILGMGDIVSLVEKAQEQYDEEEARRLQKKIAKNQFDFNDFMSQIQQIKKMGNLKDLASMIPGVGKAIKDIDIDDNAFKGIEAIIQSMTPRERTHPEILNTSRRQRIAKGSGTNIQDVNRLIKQFDQTRKMMKMVTGSKMGKMMANMPKIPGMPGMPKMK